MHLGFFFFFGVVNLPWTVTAKLGYEPSCDFCLPLYPYQIWGLQLNNHIRYQSLAIPVLVNTVAVKIRGWQLMRSANWKMPAKWNVPLTLSVLSEAGTVTPLCLTVYELVCCCNPISIGSMSWPACEWGRGQTPPQGLLSHTGPLTDQHRWIQTRNAVGGLVTLMSGPGTMVLSVSLILRYL